MQEQSLRIGVERKAERQVLRQALQGQLVGMISGLAALSLGVWTVAQELKADGPAVLVLLGAMVAAVMGSLAWHSGRSALRLARAWWRAGTGYCSLHLDHHGIALDGGSDRLRLPWIWVSRLAVADLSDKSGRALVVQARADVPAQELAAATDREPLHRWLGAGWARQYGGLMISEHDLAAAVDFYSGQTVRLEIAPSALAS